MAKSTATTGWLRNALQENAMKYAKYTWHEFNLLLLLKSVK